MGNVEMSLLNRVLPEDREYRFNMKIETRVTAIIVWSMLTLIFGTYVLLRMVGL